MNNKRVVLGVLVLAVIAILMWVAATREQWGPDLSTDPAYRSGRESVCDALQPVAQLLPSDVQDSGRRPLANGFERTLVHTFDSSRLAGGVIDVCSEYGFVTVTGIDGTEARVEITVSSPFPGGDVAIDDTQVANEFGVLDGKLQVRVAQLTQGVTSFRSFVARGSRPASVNVTVQVPRSGSYDLRLTANHQRITIRNLQMRGVLQGYASPGADIDASVDGDLKVRLSGVSYQARFATAGNLQGGTTARLRPIRSGNVEFVVDQDAVRLELIGNNLGLEVTAKGSRGNEINIGPTDSSSVDNASAYARGAGFARAPVQVAVLASSADGSVTVRRAQQ